MISVWRGIFAFAVILLCMAGIIWWHDNAGTYLKFNNGCDNPFGQGKENCTYGQFWIYMFPYFFLVGIIGIFIAIIWSTIKLSEHEGIGG